MRLRFALWAGIAVAGCAVHPVESTRDRAEMESVPADQSKPTGPPADTLTIRLANADSPANASLEVTGLPGPALTELKHLLPITAPEFANDWSTFFSVHVITD